uniref:Galactosyltransferase n=2 Tax=Kalmanozyma brasiliensis (strain GHG001) TaxID=1365824 RepID=V5E3F9_KALBG
MTESDHSEYDDNAKLRRARRGSGADPSASSMFSSITRGLRGEPFWTKSSSSYAPLPATRSRSLKKSKWNRNAVKTDKALYTNTSKDRNRGRRAASIWTKPLTMIAAFFSKVFRTTFGPIHPITMLLALIFIASFVTTVTKLIIYILNPDKEPKMWRIYCQEQPNFPHAYADALAPVDVFVGIFSIDSAYERRHVIRSTWATHTLPVDPHTGMPTSNVQVKFIIGKPRQAHARRVALEMETFNDLVVLDMNENMNRGKTHAYFQWAAENATVPFLRAVEHEQQQQQPSVGDVLLGERGLHGNGHGQTREVLGGVADEAQRYQVLWKKADYVVKVDDDAYVVLEELERHLRVAPRQLTYWGYLVRNWFMAGEAYALSSDLVQYVAHSENVLHYIKGKEDKKVAQWINLHPNRSNIHWVSERCWIYDHPKAGTAYSHGFLFPDYVEKIKLEGRRGLTDQEIARRGGEHRAKSYSTVSRWHLPYVEPRNDLTIEEEVEALVEGGGRWAGTWVRGEEGNDTQIWVPWEQIVFEADDERLKSPMVNDLGTHPALAEQIGIDPASGLTVRHINSLTPKPLETLIKADGDHQQQPPWRKRDLPFLAHLPSVPGFDFGAGGVSRSAAEERKRSFANAATQPRMIPLPTHKDGNGEAEELRNRRYLGRRFGGTVVVHYLKKSEWFYETALALSGRGRFWPDGAGGLGSEWRMYGSPLVRHEDGYISGGRSQPRPDMEVAYLQQARRQAQANAAQAAQAQGGRMGSFTKSKPAGPPAAPAQPPPPPAEQQQQSQHS